MTSHFERMIPALSKKQVINLIKVVEFLAHDDTQSITLTFGDGMEYFGLTSIAVNEDALKQPYEIPFRKGKNLEEFIIEVFEPWETKFLDKLKDSETEFDFSLIRQSTNPNQWLPCIYFKTMEEIRHHEEHKSSFEDMRDDVSYQLIIEFMKKNDSTHLIYSFEGGGDDGGCTFFKTCMDDAVIEQRSIEHPGSGEKISFSDLAYQWCERFTQNLDNWWDGNGGGGTLTINSDGSLIAEPYYIEYELKASEAPCLVKCPIPLVVINQEQESARGIGPCH